MTEPTTSPTVFRKFARVVPFAALLGCFTIQPTRAQTIAAASGVTAAELARYDLNRNGRLDADELARTQADDATAARAAAPTGATSAVDRPATDDLVQLTPFSVSADSDVGYVARDSLAGSRCPTASRIPTWASVTSRPKAGPGTTGGRFQHEGYALENTCCRSMNATRSRWRSWRRTRRRRAS